MRRHHDGAEALPKGVSEHWLRQSQWIWVSKKLRDQNFDGDDGLGDAVKHAGELFDLAFDPGMRDNAAKCDTQMSRDEQTP